LRNAPTTFASGSGFLFFSLGSRFLANRVSRFRDEKGILRGG
jgi:hypothetical protein